jgi:hypothetical protein
MSPEEKAIELVNEYMSLLFSKPIFGLTTNEAKQCALIAVDELIKSHYLLTTTHDIKPSMRCKSYWNIVKHEIENL